jgi:hypothetical protein
MRLEATTMQRHGAVLGAEQVWGLISHLWPHRSTDKQSAIIGKEDVPEYAERRFTLLVDVPTSLQVL